MRKKTSESIKKIDSVSNVEEDLKNKFEEKWSSMDTESREGFEKITARKFKFSIEVSMNCKRIKSIAENSMHAACPLCDETEIYEHLMLQEKQQ